MSLRVALFDLDLTLIPFDSGMAWLRFLVARGALEADFTEHYLACCQRYVAGEMDVRELHRVAMTPLTRHPRERLDAWREAFSAQMAAEIPAAARALVAAHRAAGDVCGIVTATNHYFAEPFARILAVEHLLASTAELREGGFTGNIVGDPCHGAGKIRRVEAWLAGLGYGWDELDHSVFYSDSISDLPLLERVAEAVAVCPDPALRAQAQARGWRIVEDLAELRAQLESGA